MFAFPDSTQNGVKESLREKIGGVFHEREAAKIHKAWSRSRICAAVKQKVDAVAHAHGERFTFLVADCGSVATQS